MWPSRLVYIALRNANEIEKLMAVCPSWEQARESSVYLLVMLHVVPHCVPHRVLALVIILDRTVIPARSRNKSSRDSSPDASRA